MNTLWTKFWEKKLKLNSFSFSKIVYKDETALLINMLSIKENSKIKESQNKDSWARKDLYDCNPSNYCWLSKLSPCKKFKGQSRERTEQKFKTLTCKNQTRACIFTNKWLQ